MEGKKETEMMNRQKRKNRWRSEEMEIEPKKKAGGRGEREK